MKKQDRELNIWGPSEANLYINMDDTGLLAGGLHRAYTTSQKAISELLGEVDADLLFYKMAKELNVPIMVAQTIYDIIKESVFSAEALELLLKASKDAPDYEFPADPAPEPKEIVKLVKDVKKEELEEDDIESTDSVSSIKSLLQANLDIIEKSIALQKELLNALPD
jgi:hypothetical protein